MVLLLSSSLAWAADKDLQQAETLFTQLEYGKALAAAERALTAADAEPVDLVQAYLIQGLCLSAQGKNKEAVGAFQRLLAIEPGYKLSRDVSPKLSPSFYQAKGLAAEQKPITLEHQPPAAPDSLGGLALPATLVADPYKMVRSVRVMLLTATGPRPAMLVSALGPGRLDLLLPKDLRGEEVAYFLEALTSAGGVLTRLGSTEQPFRLRVKQPTTVAAATPPVEPQKPVQLPPPTTDDSGALTSAPEAKPEPEQDRQESAGTAWYKSWWFWTTVGVVVAGAATGTALALTLKDSGATYYQIEVP